VTCNQIPLAGGGIAIVCGRGKPRLSEEAIILEDLRRQHQTGTKEGPNGA
jgi:hypothetical protein